MLRLLPIGDEVELSRVAAKEQAGMSDWRVSVPLNAIEAIVLDTETTGLDARQARIVQIAAIIVRGSSLERDAALDDRVDPGVPIPPASTAIHGIGDRDVVGARKFDAIAPDLAKLLAGRLVIGHSLAYDFAILKREHELAGLAWQAPRGLDMRMLARVASPSLADYSLDRICDWLGVANTARHTAAGDARATGEVFLALLPRLREAGVRTLAEAYAACGRLAEQEARAAHGLMAVDGGVPAGGLPPAAIDSFAYRHRVRDVMSRPAHFIDGDRCIGEALQLLLTRGSSSVFVRIGQAQTGIVTERDILRAVGSGSEGRDGVLSQPVGGIAQKPLLGVDEDDFVYRAIGRMERLGLRHLAVRNAAGEVTGALTPRNLLRDRAMSVIVIGDTIATAENGAALAAGWGSTPGMAASLLREGVEARAIAATLSAEIQAITRRAAELAEIDMQRAGHGPAPVPYAVLVLGSAGRGESLLAADQDNALIYARGAPDGPEDRWFEAAATIMCRLLDEAGIVFCKGGVMAKNRLWRHSAEDWAGQIEGWIRRQSPQDLLNVDIFFDAVPVHGDRALADGLLDLARERARATPAFLMMLGELARRWRQPLTLLGGFRKVDGRFDVKKGGLMPIFTAARVLALRHASRALGTKERLDAVKVMGIGAASDFERVIEAHEVLLAAVLEQQIEDAARGVPLSSSILVERLTAKSRGQLKSAVRSVETMLAILGEGRV